MNTSSDIKLLNTKQETRISYDGHLFKREELYNYNTNERTIHWSKVSHTGDDIIYTPVNVMDSYSEDILENKYQKLNDEST
jgi:hypothetical protein